MKLLVFFMAVWNLITFGMMGADKARAKADRRRISEKTLLLSGFLLYLPLARGDAFDVKGFFVRRALRIL